jgi:hypothetical protein
MSKISTANTSRNPNINQTSAWARGPPATSPSTANNLSQPIGQPQAQAPVPAPASAAATITSAAGPLSQPAVPARVNGQSNHSRRPSAAYQSSPTTLKDPVAVSKSVGESLFLLVTLISLPFFAPCQAPCSSIFFHGQCIHVPDRRKTSRSPLAGSVPTPLICCVC